MIFLGLIKHFDAWFVARVVFTFQWQNKTSNREYLLIVLVSVFNVSVGKKVAVYFALAMKPIFSLFTLCLVSVFAITAPTTLTSTITIIPLPSTTILALAHTRYLTASGTPGVPKANNSVLSHTLNYRTTLSTQMIPAAKPFFPRRNATLANSPTRSPVDYNSTSIFKSPRSTCTEETISCDSLDAFSLCAPRLTSSTKYIFIGAVPQGTVCVDGTIVQAPGDNGTCAPEGTLRCSINGTTYFTCMDGTALCIVLRRYLTLLMMCRRILPVGDMPSRTLCLGGVIFSED